MFTIITIIIIIITTIFPHQAREGPPQAGEALEARRLGGGQECSWGPSRPAAYAFSSRQCASRGSSAHRLGTAYLLCAGGSWALLTALGQALRATSQVEPWFYDPPPVGEGRLLRLLRLSGP